MVEVIAPAGYKFSPSHRGSDDNLDSDVDTMTGRTARFTLGSWSTEFIPYLFRYCGQTRNKFRTPCRHEVGAR
jgi:hypothetical protein